MTANREHPSTFLSLFELKHNKHFVLNVMPLIAVFYLLMQ